MAGGCAWSRRVGARARTLRALVRDTQRALRDVADILSIEPDILSTVEDVGQQAQKCTALVVLGTSPAARARLLRALLAAPLLPPLPPRGCRWLRIQYGSSTQVHLSLGNSEFELVEELHCHAAAWDTLPPADLLRKDQSDLTTILEVELNNQFLKDGLKILVPPDLDYDPGLTDYLTLKKLHSEFFNKRSSILRNVNPVYLYGVDRMGKHIFSDTICEPFTSSRSEEDFWNTYSLHYMTRLGNGNGQCGDEEETPHVVEERVVEENRTPAVFNGENCLDLHQIKELDPNAQVSFFLFADSEDMESNMLIPERPVEATESTEEPYRSEELPESDQGLLRDGLNSLEASWQQQARARRRLHEQQTAFMNDLMDHWEAMAPTPRKHLAKSQWALLADGELAAGPHGPQGPQGRQGPQGPGHKRKGDDRTIRCRSALLSNVVKFATDCVQASLLHHCTRLSEVHVRLVQRAILASFEQARELQVVPRRIHFAASHERQLYETITEKFTQGDKKQELLKIMQEVLQEMEVEIDNMDWSVDELPCHQDRRFLASKSTLYSSRSSPPAEDASDSEEAVSYDSYNFDDYQIIRSHEESFGASESYGPRIKSDEDSPPFNSIRVENESGMLSSSAALWSSNTNTNMANMASMASYATCTNTGTLSLKQATLDVEQTVLAKLSRKISFKLVKFMDCLKETYFGTLQRCLESLEQSCRRELSARPASEAARQLLAAARHVDLQPCASFSLLRSLLDSLRRLLHRLRLPGAAGGAACCALSPAWRRRAALQQLQQLAPQRLARAISAQVLQRLGAAHEQFQAALGALEAALGGRLARAEDTRLAIRKRHAPALARLCLEATSMADLLRHGVPDLGREIGRGQYGVVYSARCWGGHAPVAVKSVLPADERHYHELAMEFFYTRSIPAHPRVVRLWGSLVQRGAAGPGVLLVTARRHRDLHAAVRAGLPEDRRMRVACDIVQGIRYLHSLGLVHRDIKMKNVLLDSEDRAALSDLGFCAAEALMSGSLVGTPVHMAPELLAGDYDAAVDVYAFGILFWYVCAGDVKLPAAFEAFQNKEQLWSKVKRGLRPERLPQFSDECWEVMQACWAPEPAQRALLGDIQPRLERILRHALDHAADHASDRAPDHAPDHARDLATDDSLHTADVDNYL